MKEKVTKSKFPSKDEFILALRKHKEHKRQWIAAMDVKLAAIEERLKQGNDPCATQPHTAI